MNLSPQGKHNHSNMQANDSFTGPFTTGLLLAISTSLNLLHFVGEMNELFHLVASCATIGAACTTIYVGILTISKLRKEK